jgi:Predicted periplasmic protein (DUF2092)
MLATYRKMGSFEQNSVHTLEMKIGTEKNATTSLVHLAYRKPNRFLYQTSEEQEKLTIVCDGARLWIYSASLGQYTVASAPENMEKAHDVLGVWGKSSMDAFAFLQGANPLNDTRGARLLGSAKLHGVPVEIVELQGGPSERGLSDSVTRLYVGTKDHLLYESETVQSRNGFAGGPGPGAPRMNTSRTIRQTHSSIKLNKPVPDAVFTFKPPHGARQVLGFSRG